MTAKEALKHHIGRELMYKHKMTLGDAKDVLLIKVANEEA